MFSEYSDIPENNPKLFYVFFQFELNITAVLQRIMEVFLQNEKYKYN